ncbi:MAG TPA: GNAT family N-acetyltransferase, partial [Symbiobacteriaceae bacterium]|nr:GNAT family N-acetyltransferase [Symbiobacteriaceae bacterium]
REGHVGDLLTRLIAEERQRGVPLSGLYPFKQSFYRRYGWEVASAWIRHDMPTELLLHHRGRPGTVRRYAPGEADWRTLEAIYAARYSSGYGYIVRETAEHWADWVNPLWNPPAYHYHTAIWHRSPGAEPEGYLLYRFLKDDQDKWLLVVKELVALNTDAELGLYGYIAQHDSQVRTCRFRTSRDYPVWHLAENMSSTKSTLESGWMLRLVDLKLAYEQRPWPDTPDGTLTIAITDPHAPWNENTWRITFDSARAAVSPAPAETSQLSADITTLAQLWAGFIRPEQAVATGRLHCSDPRALDFLRAKEMWFYEFF